TSWRCRAPPRAPPSTAPSWTPCSTSRWPAAPSSPRSRSRPCARPAMGDHHGARVVLATHNRGKLAELRDLLAPALPGADVERLVVDAAAAGAPDVVEDGTTFEANALLKARAATAATGLIAVADDSGLAVDVLGGAPGIFSARWSGRHGDDAANLRL